MLSEARVVRRGSICGAKDLNVHGLLDSRHPLRRATNYEDFR